MKYREAAENSLTGWENSSLPIGNGYFGASVFGGIKSERIQFTTNEFANVYSLGGVTSFADFFIESDYADVTDYERGLDLNEGVAYSSFCCNGVKTERTAFCSYPDNVFVYKIKNDIIMTNRSSCELLWPSMKVQVLRWPVCFFKGSL